MHEVSLVKALLKQVDKILDEHAAPKAAGIEVEIGPLSGVEIELVQSAFDQLATTPTFDGARLSIQESPLVIECLVCGCESKLNQFVFRCTECDSGRVRVVRGDEFRLLSVTVEETVDA
jgi:hydrogenase nickel incorporation protein HypA/HybF